MIAEGFATGASIHEATGHAVAVAFNAGNLKAVAQALRAKFPTLRLIVAADDDWKTDDNPGMTKAREATKAIGGLLAVPRFPADRPDGATDFNDLARLAGLEAVRECIGSAQPVAATDSGPTFPALPDLTSAASDSEWPEPAPLPDALPPVAPFDLELLPEALRGWVADIAHRMQCPPDFPAVGAVVAISSLITTCSIQSERWPKPKKNLRPKRINPGCQRALMMITRVM